MKTEQALLRDINQILQFLVKETKLQPNDGVQAALARLRNVVTTESEHAAETLASLHARRGYLKPRRITLADNAKYLATLVPKLDPKRATPSQKAQADRARIRADQAVAEFNSCLKQLAEVEAAIAAAQ